MVITSLLKPLTLAIGYTLTTPTPACLNPFQSLKMPEKPPFYGPVLRKHGCKLLRAGTSVRIEDCIDLRDAELTPVCRAWSGPVNMLTNPPAINCNRVMLQVNGGWWIASCGVVRTHEHVNH